MQNCTQQFLNIDHLCPEDNELAGGYQEFLIFAYLTFVRPGPDNVTGCTEARGTVVRPGETIHIMGTGTFHRNTLTARQSTEKRVGQDQVEWILYYFMQFRSFLFPLNFSSAFKPQLRERKRVNKKCQKN